MKKAELDMITCSNCELMISDEDNDIFVTLDLNGTLGVSMYTGRGGAYIEDRVKLDKSQVKSIIEFLQKVEPNESV